MANETQRVEDDVERNFSAADQVVDRLEDAEQADRSFIVRWVVYLYVGSIGIAIVYLAVVQGLRWSEHCPDGIAELIKVAVVPVVTLVIGYYFGTSRR